MSLPTSVLEAKPSERLLLDFLGKLPTGRVLCNSEGRAQFAAEYARRNPQTAVTCWLLDLYQQQQIKTTQTLPPNLELVCAADAPVAEIDWVAWAFSKQGNGELVRDMLQTGHERLAVGGTLAAATDNPSDRWLLELLQNLFGKVVRQAGAGGVLYTVVKGAPLKKIKQYAAEFAFRDGERLIQLRTRPGVFNHRELDGGARSLLKTMEIQPGQKVLDLGCGSGAVGVAAALRAEQVEVKAIDSNPRAVECTRWAAEQNGAKSLQVELDCDGRSLPAGAFDLVLANPPYYSHFRIARLFVDIAFRSLKANGTMLLVTKTSQWYLEHLPTQFSDVKNQPVGNYHVIVARR